MELAEPVGVPSDAAGVLREAAGIAMGGIVLAVALAVAGGGAPVTGGGRCSIMSSASARLPPIPKGVVNAENILLEPWAGVATTPQESNSTSLVGQRKRS